MSEEEKKAIDEFNKLLADFKGLSKLSLWYEIDAERQNELYNKLYPLLNLIDKQQNETEEKTTIIMAGAEKVKQLEKEIEKLKFENHMLKKWNEQLDQNCISKDKIREKIEHYNNELEHIKNGEEFENEKPMYYWGKVALENLLEEN